MAFVSFRELAHKCSSTPKIDLTENITSDFI